MILHLKLRLILMFKTLIAKFSKTWIAAKQATKKSLGNKKSYIFAAIQLLLPNKRFLKFCNLECMKSCFQELSTRSQNCSYILQLKQFKNHQSLREVDLFNSVLQDGSFIIYMDIWTFFF